MRVPLDVQLQNHRTILQQTGGIEDEESRRLCELAFLD